MTQPVTRVLAVVGLLCALALIVTGPARADSTQTSIMQDDKFLVDSNSQTVIRTLVKMQQLGVETVRVNL
jgi:hypothetical protein